MPEDQIELVRKLCAHAGMVMEDMAALALMIAVGHPADVQDELPSFAKAVGRTQAIILAAQALAVA